MSISLLIICILPSVLFSQITARSLGMGGAYTALARGVHAPGWNPANLGLPDNPGFTFTMVSIGADIGNNSFSLGTYNEFAFDDFWDEQDIIQLLNHIPDGGLGLDVNAVVRTFSFSAGHFALTAGVDAGVNVMLDKSVLELPLLGNEMFQTYKFENIGGNGSGIGKIGLSFGNQIPVPFTDIFSVGGTLNILYGGVYAETENTNVTIVTTPSGYLIQGDYEAKYAYLGGIGWGVDLGAAAQFKEGWTLSLGLANLLGSVPWKENIEIVGGNIFADTLSVMNMEGDDAFQDSTWTIEGDAFSNKLPMALRLGCAYEEGNYLVTADYVQGFKNGAWISTKPRFSFGTEWNGLKILPLRAGIVLGGRVGFGTSFGFGIRPGGLFIDIAVLNRGFISSNSSKGLIVALEIGIETGLKK
jgi:hypothetical protein